MLGYEKRAYLSHLGVILSNISIALLVYGLVALLSGILGFFILFFLFVLWLLAIVFTIGILLLAPEFRAIPGVIAGLMSSSNITSFLLSSAPIALGIGIAISLLSTVFLFFEPSTKKHYGRIGVTLIVVAALILVLIAIIHTAR